MNLLKLLLSLSGTLVACFVVGVIFSFHSLFFIITIPIGLIVSCFACYVVLKEMSSDSENKNIYYSLALLCTWVIIILACFSDEIFETDEKFTERYLEDIRLDRNQLYSFFAKMPKGGDLHHHLTGSVYAETFWNALLENDSYVDTTTLLYYLAPTEIKRREYVQLSQLSAKTKFSLRERFIQAWSIKAYQLTAGPAANHFFATFSKFSKAAAICLKNGLIEIRNRAIAEHVSYIETMAISADSLPTLAKESGWSTTLFKLQSDSVLFRRLLDSIVLASDAAGLKQLVSKMSYSIDSLHHILHLDTLNFRLRYLATVSRISEPVDFIKRLYFAFQISNTDSLVTGVNILSREDDPTSLKYYGLQMKLFRYFHERFPNVRYSLHAGEMALGMVMPEELGFHIHDAIFVAGAQRIGHGVDIAYEKDALQTLEYMSQNKVPVEINLSSNEFILGVKNADHPVLFYLKNGVPIIISSDDAGIFRTNLSMQYVLFAERYPTLTYQQIKEVVKNSIAYSFYKKTVIKQKMSEQLIRDFATFETYIRKHSK